MSWAFLVVALLGFILAASGTSNFGLCDPQGNCDWNAYWAATISKGIGAWVVAGIIFFCLFLYLCGNAICCCCRGCRPRTKTRPVRWPEYFALAKWIVVIAAVITAILALCGFTVSLFGWYKLNDAISIVNSLIDGFLRLVRVIGSKLLFALVTAQDAVLAIQSLLNVLPSVEIFIGFVGTAVNNTVTNVENVQNSVNLLYNIYKWFMIPVALAAFVTGGILLGLAMATRGPGWCIAMFALAALFCNFVLWLALGADLVGYQVAQDICTDLARTTDLFPSDLVHPGPFVSFACNPNRTRNVFYPVKLVYNSTLSFLAEAMCSSVRSPCIESAMVCPAVPDTCRDFTETRALLSPITIAPGSSNGDCNACSIYECATSCSNQTLRSRSQVFVQSSNAGNLLTNTSVNELDPLLDCQTLWFALLQPLFQICGNLTDGLDFLAIGSILLGTAGILGIACLVVLAEWFHRGWPPHDDRFSSTSELGVTHEKIDPELMAGELPTPSVTPNPAAFTSAASTPIY